MNALILWNWLNDVNIVSCGLLLWCWQVFFNEYLVENDQVNRLSISNCVRKSYISDDKKTKQI